MIDPIRLVDEIRAFLASSDQTRNDHLESLAQGDAAACASVNQRLSECARLVQRGLRSEAIQLAAGDPPLLDLVTLLDFPERAQWLELLELYDLPRPPALQLDNANRLSEAYADENPLQTLLRQHRRLALARAPLAQRIQTMRKIAALDPTNSIWLDDTIAFEKARHRQIPVEAAEATRTHDLDRLEALHQELRGDAWQQPPAPGLVDRVRTSIQALRQQRARQCLADLEPRLNEAFAALDLAAGRRIREQWRAALKEAALSSSDPLAERAEPALHWLEREEKRTADETAFNQSITALEAALDDRAPHHQIEQIAHAIARLERGMPQVLARRLEAHLRELDVAARRKQILLVTGTVAAALLLIVTAVLFFQHQGRERAAAQAIATIDTHLETGDITAATQIHAEVGEDGLARHPRLLAAKQRIDQARAAEDRRQADFVAALSALRQADPYEAQPPARTRAMELARTENEKDQLADLLEIRQREREALVADIDATLAPRFDALARSMRAVQALIDSVAPEREIHVALVSVTAELASIATELPHASPDSKNLFQLHQSRLNTLRQQQLKNLELAEVEEGVTSAISQIRDSGDGKPYIDALAAYRAAAPESARSRFFDQVIQEQRQWEAPIAWSELATLLAEEGIPSDTADATILAARYANFLDSYSSGPDTTRISRLREAVLAAARRDGTDSLREQLLELLSDLVVDRLYLVEISEDRTTRRYYTREQFGPEGPRGGSFSYLAGHDGRERDKTFIKPLVSYVGLSPQSVISAEYKRQLLDDQCLANWDSVILALARRIGTDEKMEPLLKWLLLKRVLEVGSQGSVTLAAASERVVALLDRAGVDPTTPWMDPDDSLVASQRAKAEEALALLPGWDDLTSALDSERLKLIEVLQHTRVPVGWLARAGDDRWEARYPGPPLRDGELWLIVPREGASDWLGAGAVRTGQCSIEAESGSDLLEGRLLFMDVRTTPAP